MSSWERLQAVRAGVRSPIAVAVCAAPSRLGTLSRALLRMGSFRPPPEAAPLLPVPHALAVMPLGDGVDLEVIGVPLAPASAPMWPLALCRATVVVSLDVDGALDEASALVGHEPLMAQELVPGFSEDDEEHVAALLEAAVNAQRTR